MLEKTLIDCMWLVLCAGLIFIMQAGFLCIEAGLTRSKNAINVAIKNITDFGISSILFWCFGFALMFGKSINGWIGTSFFMPSFIDDPWFASFFLYQLMFCGTAVTIISGAVAERLRYRAYIIVTIIVSTFVYPIFGHWAWGGIYGGESGWLRNLGFIDFSGSTVVHCTGGWTALAVLMIIGHRIGRYQSNGESHTYPGSHIPMAILGVLLLWIGWIGFNGGSTYGLSNAFPKIIINTMLAGSGGMLAALTLGWLWYGYPKVILVMNGSLAGLVSITAGCFAVNTGAAIIIGAIGGCVMVVAQHLIDHFQIDDVVGAVPVHVAAGIWGTLAVALFGNLEILGTGLTRPEQFQVQIIGILSAFILSFGIPYLILRTINQFFPLRISIKNEMTGLNVAEHREKTEAFDLLVTMEEQIATKNLSLRVPVEPYTEIGQIAQRYNTLMDSLQTSLTSISNLQMSEQALKEKTLELERTNRDLQSFAHVVAHDLKAPLRNIAGFGSLIIDDVKDELNEKTQDYLQEMLNGISRMNVLIEDILQFAGVSEKQKKFVLVDLFKIIEEVQKDLQENIRRTNAKIQIDENLPTIDGHPTLLRQLFQNLIGNALKYGRPNISPVIRIHSRTLQDRNLVQIILEDNGIGFTDEQASRIFEPFKRLKEAAHYEGTGIGLATCVRIVEKHNGQIEGKGSPNKGATFTVTLPLKQKK